jgi:hypothetical protein
MHASGPACQTAYGPDALYSWPPIWICDSDSRRHATRTSGQSGMNGEIALRLEIVPPLSRATTSIEVRTISFKPAQDSRSAGSHCSPRQPEHLLCAARHRRKPDNGAKQIGGHLRAGR